MEKETNITYVKKAWDLYIVHLLMQVREYKQNIDSKKRLVETTHHIESVLFQAESPEESFNRALELMARHSDANHDGKYDLREHECVGLYDLDSMQCSVGGILEEIQSEMGFSLDCISFESVDINALIGTPKKERLALFKSV